MRMPPNSSDCLKPFFCFQEIDSHLSGNRQRNAQLREVDLPAARQQQSAEEAAAAAESELRRQRMRQVEARDHEVARNVLESEQREAHRR